jgi:hypothetical protein
MIGSADAGDCVSAVAEIAVVASSINLIFVMMSLGVENNLLTSAKVKRSL